MQRLFPISHSTTRSCLHSKSNQVSMCIYWPKLVYIISLCAWKCSVCQLQQGFHYLRISRNSIAHTICIRFNFHIPLYSTVMVPATFTQLIIKSVPLVTSVIHLGSGSLILQPIIGSFNNTYCNLRLQLTLSWIRGQSSREFGSPGITFNLKVSEKSDEGWMVNYVRGNGRVSNTGI